MQKGGVLENEEQKKRGRPGNEASISCCGQCKQHSIQAVQSCGMGTKNTTIVVSRWYIHVSIRD